MPKRRKRKTAEVAPKSTERDGRVIHISDCQTVMIGESNTVVKEESHKRVSEIEVRQETAMMIVKQILRVRKKPMHLDELQDCVAEALKESDANTFEELCDVTLKDFLLSHSEIFEVCRQKNTLYASLVQHEDTGSRDKSKKEFTKTSQSDGKQNATANSSDETVNSDNTSEGDLDGAWSQVKKKVKKRKTKSIQKTQQARPLAREIQHSQVESYIVKKFKDLISRNEDRDLLFVPDQEQYANHPEKCMHDIVCMWNTPQRTKSYIVIGVENVHGITNLNGISSDCDLRFYEADNLFSQTVFTMRPVYQYHSVEYDMKVFCIIEISSSSGCGQPSIVKTSHKSRDLVLKENELWFRRGTSNVVCPPTDLTIGSIYQWFLGAIDKITLSPEAENKVSKGSSVVQNADKQVGDYIQRPESKVGKIFSQFWEDVNQFRKGNFILIAGDVSNQHLNLAHLSLIDWLAVYDFDVFSCSTGLLNAVQDSLEKRRQLRIGSWNESPPMLTEDGTYWCFLRGRREISSSRTDNGDRIFESVQSWFKLTKYGLDENCDQLSTFSDNYSVFTVMILWPEHEELVSFIRKFLDKLTEQVCHLPKIIVCLDKEPETEIGQTQLKTIQLDFVGSIHVCVLNFSQLCLGIKNHIAVVDDLAENCELPTANGLLSPIMDEKDVVWLKEDLEMLYLQSPYQKSRRDEKALEDEMAKFFKGGTLHWFARYEMEDSCVDVERDVLKKVEEIVEKNMEENYRAVVIAICHAPGSGGTTLAQRILWKYHTRIPCCQARSGTILKAKEFERKISYIHEKTQLPVLLMIDGEDDAKIKYLSGILKHTVILHVKRFPWSMHKLSEKNKKDKVYLSGRVSANEAEKLAAKFGEKCDSIQQKRLNTMRDEVKKKKAQHIMYEFGMTVYHHEFKGLVSYVEGYLQLEQNSTEDLLPWQRCLGYLSLVYFYGQTSVPCQFFAALLGKSQGYCMTIEDFPYPTTEFVVHDDHDRKTNTIRICHFEIAKEILEQILARRVRSKSKTRTDRLGENAKRNLAQFCMEFIEYCSRRKTKDTSSHQTVKHILTKTFIYRDEVNRGENEEQDFRKKQQVSQLLLDIPSSKPLFAERLQILEKLSSAFPDDPNYHAHVGRFHAFCGPDNEQKAEKRFEKAITLCEKKNKGKKTDDLNDSMKSTLMHIYHMWGVLNKRRIGSLAGKPQNDQSKVNTEVEFNKKLTELVEIAETACDYLTKSRDITPDQCDVFIHAFTSEIDVRLRICDFVMQHFKTISEPEMIFSEFLESSADESSKYFVIESIQKIERLILECYMDVNLETEDQANLKKLVKWYNALFKRQVLPDNSFPTGDEISNIRQQITSLKLQHGAQNLSMEGVHDEAAFNAIIGLYEEEFREIHSKGHSEKLDKKEVEYDYREWIFAIRQDQCSKSYSLEDVLLHVQNWHHLVRSPMSTFYLFVLNSLLGIGTDKTPGRTECLLDAQNIKTELSRKNGLVIRPKYPREWLGSSGSGIKLLQTANRRIGLNENREAGKGLVDLAVCKGTICHPNSNRFGGHIELDMKVGTVKVFYIPKRVNLEGPRYAGQRVEFNLAFSIEHGYEAFNVRLLKRHGCSSCSATIEFRSIDDSLPCVCGEMIHKDPLNEVSQEEKCPGYDTSESEVFE